MTKAKPLMGYVAHPFGGDMLKLDCAELWCAELSLLFSKWREVKIICLAPWIPLCRHWPNTGDVRSKGLEIGKACVMASDILFLTGGAFLADRATSALRGGMRDELEAAKAAGVRIVNLLDIVDPTSLRVNDYRSRYILGQVESAHQARILDDNIHQGI